MKEHEINNWVQVALCCSNHSSLKDKWSYNKQSSPMGYQVKSGGITRKLDKEPSLHCSSIYTTTSWSMLQQCVYLMSIHHASTSRPLCFLHVPWRHTFNLHCTCAHHVYTMRNHSPLKSSLTLTPFRLFPILLDPKSFQTTLAFVTWLPGHVLSIRCRLIIITTIYTCPNSNPSPSLSTCSIYNTLVVWMPSRNLVSRFGHT